MESVVKAKNLKGSARKARLVVDLIRGRAVEDARNILKFSNKYVSGKILKLLNSAITNIKLKENNFDENSLRVLEVFVDGAKMAKRYRPRAHGRATVVRKKSCHITLKVKSV